MPVMDTSDVGRHFNPACFLPAARPVSPQRANGSQIHGATMMFFLSE
jgi:hypothetical protein